MWILLQTLCPNAPFPPKNIYSCKTKNLSGFGSATIVPQHTLRETVDAIVGEERGLQAHDCVFKST